ncbi:DUF1876 domain-containing protein [Streptomyces sp. Vc74B-19]|uniref:DUF1876 domain-containing protein n=1 Tax=unclassified Streptomyces TaxID=2593676 RepID=UPI001BFCA551|nr:MULTISPECIES: DUF1876 domain-containing protein [unclassified Streptomyces]MBT3167375.1 DUF1876 domain-containing protein [Streptomyces sp. Vc74B-19]MCO4696049.1 hypothetical protein [Streptomyces sp. RO-S4]MDU0302298.1 DUF1876 domain-containing protein [Streptomyces sp. PAL114]
MARTLEWKTRLYLFEEEGVTKARATLDTGTTVLTGHGTAHRNPADTDVPEIGDELAAGRALRDLGRHLLDIAEQDVETASPERPDHSPVLGWSL